MMFALVQVAAKDPLPLQLGLGGATKRKKGGNRSEWWIIRTDLVSLFLPHLAPHLFSTVFYVWGVTIHFRGICFVGWVRVRRVGWGDARQVPVLHHWKKKIPMGIRRVAGFTWNSLLVRVDNSGAAKGTPALDLQDLQIKPSVKTCDC